jgi:hypothetical protein
LFVLLVWTDIETHVFAVGKRKGCSHLADIEETKLKN